MANFWMVYLQLFAGWMVLNLATLSLSLVPHSAMFFDLCSSADDAGQLWTYGVWVVVQIALFFTLLILTTALMSACENVPQEAGFVHLIVDPSLVTLGCVPFLLITGLPRANYIENCLQNTTLYDLHPQLLLPNVSGAQAHPMLGEIGEIPLPVRYAPPQILSPEDCLLSQFYWADNSSQMAAIFTGNGSTVAHAQSLLTKWKVAIETSLVLPVVLHLLHYHWKMPWQPFLQSNLYLLLQALDLVYFLDTSIHITNPNLKLCTETLVYVNALLLCVACLSLATPPLYCGPGTSGDYLRVLMAVGTVAEDLVHLIVRIVYVLTEGGTGEMGERTRGSTGVGVGFHGRSTQPLFYILIVKNAMCVAGLLYYGLVRSPCIKPEYDSLLTQEPESDEVAEKEDFV